MSSLKDAVLEAINHKDQWLLPAAIVQYNDTCEFDAVPNALTTDISWTGRERGFTKLVTLGADELEEAWTLDDDELNQFVAYLQDDIILNID